MPATTFAVFWHGVDSSRVDTQSTCIFPFLKSDEEGWVLSAVFSSAFVQDLQQFSCIFMFDSSFQLHVMLAGISDCSSKPLHLFFGLMEL